MWEPLLARTAPVAAVGASSSATALPMPTLAGRSQARPSTSARATAARLDTCVHRPRHLAAASRLATSRSAHCHEGSSAPLASMNAHSRPWHGHEQRASGPPRGTAALAGVGLRPKARHRATGRRAVLTRAISTWGWGFPGRSGSGQWRPQERLVQGLTQVTIPGQEKVVGLACVGFLWSCSTMMVTSLLPVFMRVELGASNLSIGMLEVFATCMNTVAKVCSGVISDKTRNRGRVIAIGSVVTALVKFLFASATSVYGVFVARSLDRLAKGIRMAPTDALLADLSPVESRSRTYGLYYSMMTLGAVCGGIWASGCMAASGDNFRFTFALATVPALLATALLDLVTDLEADDRPASVNADGVAVAAGVGVAAGRDAGLVPGFRRFAQQVEEGFSELAENVQCMPPRFWASLAVFAVLMTARFSEAFVFLHARSVGVPIAMIPMFAIANNLIQATMAYPLGCLTDRVDRKTMLLAGFIVLAVSDVILMFGKTPAAVLVGFMFTGLHMAMTHSNMKALMSETIPEHMRGTGFAVMAIASGVSLAAGNLLAGSLSDVMGSGGAFLGGLVSVTFATLLGSILL